jgi:hypothetical protein
MAHVKLAGGGSGLRAVGNAVDDNATRAANSFATVVVKDDGRLASLGQVLVDHVEHFQEGHVGADVLGLDPLHVADRTRILLPPDHQDKIHGHL